MKKRILAFSAVFTAILLFALIPLCTSKEKPSVPVVASVDSKPEATPEPTPEPAPAVTTLRFSATGDNLIHQGIYKQAARRAAGSGLSGYDFSYCFDEVRDFYSGFDINWLNQETLVNTELEPSTYPCFSTPGEMGKAAYEAGFRVFNLSNNHSYDKGAAGIAATRRFWATMPDDTITCGLYKPENPEITIQQKDNVSIAYLSYTEHTNGLRTPQNAEASVIYTNETDRIRQQVEEARKLADFVVVSTHWGVEGSHRITDAQKALAQQLVDWGADLVIGTGPHVIQDAEWLTSADGRIGFVAYSLGNFLNAQSQPDCMIGATLSLEIVKTTQPDGTSETVIQSPLLYPVIDHYGPHYSDIRVYMFQDYTEELAQEHGIRQEYPSFSLSYIEKALRDNISEEFRTF